MRLKILKSDNFLNFALTISDRREYLSMIFSVEDFISKSQFIGEVSHSKMNF